MIDIERVRTALAYIEPYDRDEWVKMGMAIKSELGDDGFSVWDEWSRQADNYDPGAARDSWRSFRDGAITGGSLFHQAKTNGWQDDGQYKGPTQEQLSKRRAKALENAEKERLKAERAAIKAKMIWQASTPAMADHPYLVKKGIKPVDTLREITLARLVEIIGYQPQSDGVPLVADRILVVPVKVCDHLATCEFIDVSGRKTALAGGQKSGGYWAAQRLPSGDGQGLSLGLGEGVSTVLSVQEATSYHVVAALTCSNLLAVARMLQGRYPAADLVILADLGNGQAKAEEAAKSVGGRLALPDFGMARPDGATDFNDLGTLRGLKVVKTCVESAINFQTERRNSQNSSNSTSNAENGPSESYNLDSANDVIQRLRGALAVIPLGAMVERHTAELIIGWGLRHNKSEIETHIGELLCNEWDKRTGGKSHEIFINSDPDYDYTSPVTKASIYDLAKKCGWVGKAPWGEPLPLIAHQQADPYPLDSLPGIIGAAVREVVAFVQCPVALGACSALAVIATVAQGLVDVRRAEKLEGPTSLFMLAIADSGERKSTVDGFFSKPVREWEAEQAEAAKPDLQRFDAAKETWEAKKSGLLAAIKDAAKGGKSTGDLESMVADLEAEKPAPPKVPRLLFGDSTPEALAYRLAHGWPVGGVLSSEAGVVFGGHAMGKDSAMRNMAMLNSLWGAEPLTIDRRSVESFTVRGARLTMGLAVQSETVRSFIEGSKGLARGIGFLARFLIAWPESTQGKRMFKDPSENWPHLAKFHRRLGALLDHSLMTNDRDELQPEILELSPEAKAVWVAFHDDVEAELRPGRDMAEAKDVASKAADNAARLAAIFHLFENDAGGTIGRDYMMKAAVVAGWHLYEARRFMGEIATPVELNNAAKLDAWLLGYCKQNQVEKVSTTTIQQKGPNCIREKRTLTPALEELSEADRVRVVKDGRRKLVEINPALIGDRHGPA